MWCRSFKETDWYDNFEFFNVVHHSHADKLKVRRDTGHMWMDRGAEAVHSSPCGCDGDVQGFPAYKVRIEETRQELRTQFNEARDKLREWWKAR